MRLNTASMIERIKVGLAEAPGILDALEKHEIPREEKVQPVPRVDRARSDRCQENEDETRRNDTPHYA